MVDFSVLSRGLLYFEVLWPCRRSAARAVGGDDPPTWKKGEAFGSTDPDNHTLHYKWWNYWEAGSYSGNVHPINPEKIECTFPIPTDAPKGTVFHVILEVTDSGSPALTSFRRVVITVD